MTINIVNWAKESIITTFLLSCTFSCSLELLTFSVFTGFVFFVPINMSFHTHLLCLSPISLRVNLSDTLSGSSYIVLLDFFYLWRPVVLEFSLPFPQSGFTIFFKYIFSFFLFFSKNSSWEKRAGEIINISHLLKCLYSVLKLEW